MRDAVDADVDAAGQHEQAELALAGADGFGLAGSEPDGAEADMLPAGALRGDLDDLAPAAGGLGKQVAWHLVPSPVQARRSTRPRRVW